METEINMQIVRLRETEFSINLPAIDNKQNDFDMGMNLQLNISKIDDSKLSLQTSIILVEVNSKDELLKYSCQSIFQIENMQDALEFTEEELKEKVDIMPTLFSITFSSMRGMIALKVAGTKLEDYPLPIINPTQIYRSLTADIH